MRILILTQWYPPEPALLIQELAQTLHFRGHDVTVLTGFPNYPSGKIYPGYRLRLRQREILNGVPVIRVALYSEHSRSGLRRALNYISFALSSSFLGPWSVARPDVIFVYHPPLTIGLPAYILSRLWGVPFVYQIQDMWPETLRATGMLHNASLLRWVGRFARWIYSKAHTILVISPGFRRNLLEKGVQPEKIRVVSNWAEGNADYQALPDNLSVQNLDLVRRFNVMFAGNLGEAQGLETVIKAAVLLEDLKDVQFVFVGDGVALSRLKEIAEAQELLNIRFLGRYPHDAMPGLFALADVLLVHLKDDPLFRITIPHKVLTYLGTGKPILAAVAGDAADLVIEARAGVACPPENPCALAETVRCLYAMKTDERRALGERGLQAARTRYSRDVLTREIETVLMKAATFER